MGNACWKKTNRCQNAQPVSFMLSWAPVMKGAISAYKQVEIPDDWTVLEDTNCQGSDLHPTGKTALTINDCIYQCYGFILFF